MYHPGHSPAGHVSSRALSPYFDPDLHVGDVRLLLAVHIMAYVLLTWHHTQPFPDVRLACVRHVLHVEYEKHAGAAAVLRVLRFRVHAGGFRV